MTTNWTASRPGVIAGGMTRSARLPLLKLSLALVAALVAGCDYIWPEPPTDAATVRECSNGNLIMIRRGRTFHWDRTTDSETPLKPGARLAAACQWPSG